MPFGVGVSLNILFSNKNTGSRPAGVPVHVLLRSVLDAASVEDAVATLETCNKCYATQSCISVADEHGKYAICELNGETTDTQWQVSPPIHTNHYTGLGGVGVTSRKPSPRGP